MEALDSRSATQLAIIPVPEALDSRCATQLAITELAAAISSLSDSGEGHCDLAALELQVARLGLWPYEDWSLKHFPSELHQFCGYGLGIWQYPKQFVPLLLLLHRYDIRSYLEIGVAAGGTFTLICELLNRWSRDTKFEAVACDPAPPGCVNYLLETHYKEGFQHFLSSSPWVQYIQEFSHRLERVWPQKGKGILAFDCIFIDGDHSFEGCWADFEMAQRINAGIIILHDIVNVLTPGVCEAWQLAKERFADDFVFEEFVGQYEEVQQTHGHDLLGIGVCIRKTMPLRCN